MIRSRIKENFSEELLVQLYDLTEPNCKLTNNERVETILNLLSPLGFIELGAGTNRFAMLKDEYVYKIALDIFGIRDNWQEFKMSKELQPYVTKTYESNGLITVSEYVTLISKEEFIDSKDNIRAMLKVISEDYIFEDIGTISKNYCNYGFNESGYLVILDYGYIYPKEQLSMFCDKCGGSIGYNSDYSKLICRVCGKKFDVLDVKKRMDTDVKDYKDFRNEKFTVEVG